MTDQHHPLTDEICLEISNRPYMIDTRKDDMRAAYDKGREDLLEQVVEWLYDYEVIWPPSLEWIADRIEEVFNEAIHPQENN